MQGAFRISRLPVLDARGCVRRRGCRESATYKKKRRRRFSFLLFSPQWKRDGRTTFSFPLEGTLNIRRAVHAPPGVPSWHNYRRCRCSCSPLGLFSINHYQRRRYTAQVLGFCFFSRLRDTSERAGSGPESSLTRFLWAKYRSRREIKLLWCRGVDMGNSVQFCTNKLLALK